MSDRGLHQRRTCEKQPAAIRHQHVIAHHRKVTATGDAHPHDGRDLWNAHGRHHGIIAKYAAEIVGVGKDIFLQRQKHARGIDQIDGRNVVLDGDVLRPNYFLRSHREERACLHGRVIGDDHDHPGLNPR